MIYCSSLKCFLYNQIKPTNPMSVIVITSESTSGPKCEIILRSDATTDNIICNFFPFHHGFQYPQAKSDFVPKVIGHLERELAKVGLPLPKTGLFITAIRELTNNIYDHANSSGTISITFCADVCSFEIRDENTKAYDYPTLLENSEKKKGGLALARNALYKLCDTLYVKANAGLTFSGSIFLTDERRYLA